MVKKNDPGIKTAKERISVLVCVSALGKKLKLAIGRSATPDDFMTWEIASLGVNYPNWESLHM